MPDDKAKHLVELDEKILTVFNVDPTEKMQELFNAKDADIDRTANKNRWTRFLVMDSI